jgi:hypothetical protein
MSLDKFLGRGFTGSLGSGEGRWVAQATPHQQPSQQGSTQGGTSFVMGGGPLKGRPQANSNKDNQYREERYAFDAHEVRSKGSVKEVKQHKECMRFTSVSDALSTRRGHQVLVGIAMYGIALMVGIFLLYAYFGSSDTDGYYTPPPGLSRNARPLWDR